MSSYISRTNNFICSLDSPLVLAPLSCIPIVWQVIQVVKDINISDKLSSTNNLSNAKKLLEEKKRIRKFTIFGACVQTIVFVAFAIFIGTTWWSPIITVIPMAIIIALNIHHINKVNEAINLIDNGTIWMPRNI